MEKDVLTVKSKFNREAADLKIPSIREAYIIKIWAECQIDNPDRTSEFYIESTLRYLEGKLNCITQTEINNIIDKFLSDDKYYKRMESFVSAMHSAGV